MKTETLFPLGQVVATPGALAYLEAHQVDALDLLARHQHGEWGQLDPEDIQANNDALTNGDRLLSSYPVGEGKIWVITEWDRSATTLLLPSEY